MEWFEVSRSSNTPAVELDVRGLLCPLPVLKARKRLATMNPGEILTVRATDPAAVIDFPHYCNESGNALLEAIEEPGEFRFVIQKSHGN